MSTVQSIRLTTTYYHCILHLDNNSLPSAYPTPHTAARSTDPALDIYKYYTEHYLELSWTGDVRISIR